MPVFIYKYWSSNVAFIEAAALRSVVLVDMHAPRQPHALVTYLVTTICVSFCFVGDVAFSEYFWTIAIFSLYGEYIVRSFLLDGVFLPCDHGLDF